MGGLRMKPKREPRYTMRQIGKAWDLAVATYGGFNEWNFSAAAGRVRLSLKRQAAAEKRKKGKKR